MMGIFSAGRFATLLIFALSSIPLLHGYQEVSDQTLRDIPSGEGDFDIHSGPLLAPILIPRVPGTPGSHTAQRHFIDFFEQHLHDWEIIWHNSSSRTPATGDTEVPFANLIFRRDPPWARVGDVGRLTLVAHYDSLYRPDGFIGATDSAAPCSILMHVARSIDTALTKKWDDMKASGDADMGLDEEKGVQILLLDGEEAWVTWGPTDSLYGARALAETWDSEVHPAVSTYRTPINSISLFLLIDLLGGPNPHVPSYFQNTHWAYQGMAKIESRMRKLGLLQSKPSNHFLPDSRKTNFASGYIEDDHIPFLRRGVPILHVIPNPFPDVWHKMEDDGEHLDGGTIDDWAKIITAFVTEWMELDGFVGSSKQAIQKDNKIRERSEL